MHEQTLAIHAGYDKDSMGTMAVPIYQTTAYEFRDTEHAATYCLHSKNLGIFTHV